VQQYLWLSVDLYGVDWMLFPSVLVLAALTALTVAYPFIRRWQQGKKNIDMDVAHELVRAQEKGSLGMSGVLVVMFLTMLAMGTLWPLRASLPVYFIAGLGLVLTLMQIARDAYTLRVLTSSGKLGQPFTRSENILELNAWLWLGGLVVGAWLFGFHLTFFFYPIIFGYVYGAPLRGCLYISVSALALLWLIFDFFQGAVWPNVADELISGAMLQISSAIGDEIRSWRSVF
jgi:hypothetical protein